MHPMVKSENPWNLKITMNKIVIVNSVKPSKKATSSMFDIYNEHATFVGTEKLNPFDFDTFAVCLSNVVEADSIRVGINIQYLYL
jgi:hypothetical protein